MGFLFFTFLWGVVALEEIERTPNQEWQNGSFWRIFKFKRTRKSVAFMLALLIGFLFFIFEIRMIILGRSTFHFLESLGFFGFFIGLYIYSVIKKGRE